MILNSPGAPFSSPSARFSATKAERPDVGTEKTKEAPRITGAITGHSIGSTQQKTAEANRNAFTPICAHIIRMKRGTSLLECFEAAGQKPGTMSAVLHSIRVKSSLSI